MIEVLAGRCQAVARMHVGFCFERLGDHIEKMRPAEPTLDGNVVYASECPPFTEQLLDHFAGRKAYYFDGQRLEPFAVSSK